MDTTGNQLQIKVENLVDAIDRMINQFEDETGMSITAAKIRFDEKECKKHIYFKMQYYNFEQALVNSDNQI